MSGILFAFITVEKSRKDQEGGKDLQVIAIANQKGGCGKTTTSINFAACLAYLGKKVLLADLDPQGHTTCGLGVKAEDLPYTLYDLLQPREGARPEMARVLKQLNPYLACLPSYGILNTLEEELIMYPDKEKRLKYLVDQLQAEKMDFDYMILDCPPNLGILTFNALEAADHVLIPIEPSFFSLHGLGKISETIRNVDGHRLQPLEVHALLTLFDSRTSFAQEVYEEVKAHFRDRLFKTIIHESVALKEAAGAGQSIVQYDQSSTGFQDYFNLAVEYLEREWNRRLPARELGWDQVYYHHYGPRRVAGGVLFQMVSKSARSVEVAGDFNHWVPEPLNRRSDDGLWQKIIPIHEGAFRYKFIVDGEWQIDPYQPTQRVNQFGTVDSYLELV